MDTLKPRKYYNLSYSVMPDNKIQQVVGTFTETAYSEVDHEEEAITKVLNLKNGASGYQNLPAFNTTEQATTTDVFENVFAMLDVGGDGGDDYDGYRTEDILAQVTVDIYHDEPMTYISAATNDSVGKRRIRTATSGWLTSLGWLIAFDTNPRKVYGIKNFNASGAPSSSSTTSSVTTAVKRVEVDPTYDGTKVVAGMYLLRLTATVIVYDCTMWYHIEYDESDPGNPRITAAEGELDYQLIEQFDLVITYGTRTTAEVEFEYHVDVPEYANYPLKISGNEYTDSNCTYNNVAWHQWISNQLLDKYKDGKIFINSKIKASYLIENNLDINSEILIKDIDNQFIRRGEYMCVFQLKNIEYEYDGSQYIANVILLEDYTMEEILVDTGFEYIIAQITEMDVTSKTCAMIIIDKPIVILEIKSEMEHVQVFPLEVDRTLAYFDVLLTDMQSISPGIIEGDTDFGFDIEVSTASREQIPFEAKASVGALDINVSGQVRTTKSFDSYVDFGCDLYFDPYSFTKIHASWELDYVVDVANEAITAAETKQTSFEDVLGPLVSNVAALCIESFHFFIDSLELAYCNQVIPSFRENLLEPATHLYFGTSESCITTQFSIIKDIKNTLFEFSSGLDIKITFTRLMDRPINDEYFFNVSIEDWVDLSIENMLEIKI